MPGKPGYARSGYNRARVEWQHTALVTQGRPGRSEQKDFDVLWLCSRGRPDAYLSTIPDLEVRNVSDPDKGTLSRVLKQKSAGTFPDGGIPSLDLNRDIDITSIV